MTFHWTFPQYVSVLDWRTPNWTQNSQVCWTEGNGYIPRPDCYTLAHTGQDAPRCAAAHCGLQLLAWEAAQVLFCKLLSTQSVPSLYWCIGFFHPRCRPLRFHICYIYIYVFVYIFYFQLVRSWPIQNLLIRIFKHPVSKIMKIFIIFY